MKATIPYLQGYIVKPYVTFPSGEVFFTDGTNIGITPNQQQCEAYGYTYNKETGTCTAFTPVNKLGESITNTNNNVQGSNNVTETGTNNSYVMGENNTIKGLSRNNVVVGSNNEIANGINNASVFGNFGLAQRQGEIVLGGGGFSGAGTGNAQSSTIALTGTTTDASATSLFVNGDSNTTIITRTSGIFLSFEAVVMGVRTGGSAASGAVNDRISVKVYGLVYTTTVDQSTYDIGKFGTTGGWGAAMQFSGSDMVLQVSGAASMNISWSATLDIYELKV